MYETFIEFRKQEEDENIASTLEESSNTETYLSLSLWDIRSVTFARCCTAFAKTAVWRNTSTSIETRWLLNCYVSSEVPCDSRRYVARFAFLIWIPNTRLSGLERIIHRGFSAFRSGTRIFDGYRCENINFRCFIRFEFVFNKAGSIEPRPKFEISPLRNKVAF